MLLSQALERAHFDTDLQRPKRAPIIELVFPHGFKFICSLADHAIQVFHGFELIVIPQQLRQPCKGLQDLLQAQVQIRPWLVAGWSCARQGNKFEPVALQLVIVKILLYKARQLE